MSRTTAVKRNPFRARQISPGRLPYLFPEGQHIGQVVERFISSGMRGQIIGPHGTGKSTLLENLANVLRQRDYQVHQVSLSPTPPVPRRLRPLRLLQKDIAKRHRDGPLVPSNEQPSSTCDNRLIAIDGCEVASWWERCRFFRVARRTGWGILVTSHRDLGLPTLWKTDVTLETALRIIHAIVALEKPSSEMTGQSRQLVRDDVVERLLAKHHGDMREVLFSLYDRCRADLTLP